MENKLQAKEKWGINAFWLKVFALIMMTMDHVHYFFSTIGEMPIFLHLIGRIAAPIFLFMIANGFMHTRHRGKYFMRLYIGAVAMQLLNMLVNHLFPLRGDAIVINGIFSTMSVIVWSLIFIEGMRKSAKERKFGKTVLCLMGFLLPWIIGVLIFPILMWNLTMGQILMVIIPMPLIVEGGVFFILMGIGFYYCRKSKVATAIFYLVMLLIIYAGSGFTTSSLIECLFMLIALVLILLYNGEKGRGMKYLFYFYYPAHIYILAIVVSLIGSK